MPSEFVSWVIQHVGATVGASIVVANYEADAQLAKLRSDGAIDLVYSAAQDSDFLVYQGMGEIIYDLHNDGSFKLVDLHRDVLGKKIKEFDFACWSETTFRVWSAACGCDYVENPVGMGAVKLYKLINSNLALDEDDLVKLVASKAANASAYAVSLLAAVRSFQHHVVFEVGTNGAIKQVHLKPLPSNVALSGYKALTDSSVSTRHVGRSVGPLDSVQPLVGRGGQQLVDTLIHVPRLTTEASHVRDLTKEELTTTELGHSYAEQVGVGQTFGHMLVT